MFSIKDKVINKKSSSSSGFHKYLVSMKEKLQEEMVVENINSTDMVWKALLGDSEAITYHINMIEKYMRSTPFHGDYPAVYRNAKEALFQEWRGFGPAYQWFTDQHYSYSSGLQFIGTQIFYAMKGEYRKYPYAMTSIDRVEQLRRSLQSSDPRLQMDASRPSGELKMNDPLWPGRFIRIAIWMPPRVWDGFTTITMRRQIIDHLNLEEQAAKETFDFEAKEMIQALIQCKPHMLIVGPVGGGKSTFANTVVGEQLSDLDRQQKTGGVIMIEKHPESILPYVIQNHRIIPIISDDSELMHVGIESLRHDPHIIYMTEMRYHEWEFYNFAAEKGHAFLVGTYHTTDPEDIPYQGAQAIYRKLGGSEKGHLISTLSATNIVIVMEPWENGVKKLTRISEIRYDPIGQTVYSHDLMRYDRLQNQYYYSDELSGELFEKMENRDYAAAQRLKKQLSYLAGVRRIQNPLKESLKCRLVLSGGAADNG